MTQPPSVERTPKGSWFRQALAHLAVYRTSDRAERAEVVASYSRTAGLALNTAVRQLTALAYLAERAVDLEALASRPPALMAIEAVARVARVEPDREGELLRALVSGQRTIEWFRREAEKIGKSAEPVEKAPTLRLSDILRASAEYYGADMLGLDEDWGLRLEFRSGGPETPLVVVEHFLTSREGRRSGARKITTWLFKIEAGDPRVQRPHFQERLDRCVLHGALSADHVVICAELTLPLLNETRELLHDARDGRRVRGLAPVTLVDCALDVDLEQPKGDERWRVFEYADDYFEKYGRGARRSREEIFRDEKNLREAYHAKLDFGAGQHPRGL